jgi:hypothetical protein
MHQYNVGTLFERIAIDILAPYLENQRENRYLLIAIEYFIKWPSVIKTHRQWRCPCDQSLVKRPTTLWTQWV